MRKKHDLEYMILDALYWYVKITAASVLDACMAPFIE